MIYDLKYCPDPNVDCPKMFIDKEIGGKDENGEPNIDGHLFLKELLYLSDTLGKKNIEVWINSPGGLVTEGMSIYTAILNSKAKVDTYCYGIAASISGVIFQAGRNRIIADYATLMYHNPYSEDGKKDDGLEAMRLAIVKMIATRTGKDEDMIAKVMKQETWITADEAVENGFADEVKASGEVNIKRVPVEAKARWEYANLVLNRTPNTKQPKPKSMKNVCNKLGLHEDSSESSILSAIEAMNKSAEAKYDDLKAALDKKMAECDDLKAKMAELEKAKNEMEEKAKAEAEMEAKAKAEADEKACDEAIKNAVAVGKIKNEESVITHWKNSWKANSEITKGLLDAIAPTKTAPKFVSTPENVKSDSPAEAAAKAMNIKPGSAAWYNAIKSYEISNKK